MARAPTDETCNHRRDAASMPNSSLHEEDVVRRNCTRDGTSHLPAHYTFTHVTPTHMSDLSTHHTFLHVKPSHTFPYVTPSHTSHLPARHTFPHVTPSCMPHLPARHTYPHVTPSRTSHHPARHTIPHVTPSHMSHLPASHTFPQVPRGAGPRVGGVDEVAHVHDPVASGVDVVRDANYVDDAQVVTGDKRG